VAVQLFGVVTAAFVRRGGGWKSWLCRHAEEAGCFGGLRLVGRSNSCFTGWLAPCARMLLLWLA
jgi:hypothetical protein